MVEGSFVSILDSRVQLLLPRYNNDNNNNNDNNDNNNNNNNNIFIYLLIYLLIHTYTIDLSLCLSTVILDFDWKVLPDLHGSNHFPITLTSAEGE